MIVQQSTYNPWGGNMSTPTFSGMQPQPTQPNQIPSSYTGAGFGGYGAQPAQPQVQQNTTGNPFVQQQPQFMQPQMTQSFSQQNLVQPQMTQQFNQPLQAQNTMSQNGLQRTSTNPFAGMSTTSTGKPVAVNSTNPFGNTRFGNEKTTPYSFSQDREQRVSVTATGSNPFMVSQSTKSVFDNAERNQNTQQPLKSQPTAGGLENLPTMAVFPETQQQQTRNAYLDNARNNLVQQATGGFQQNPQQQFQPQLTQQPTQFQNQFQPQFTQQPQMQPQFTQPHQGNPNQFYSEPSLI